MRKFPFLHRGRETLRLICKVQRVYGGKAKAIPLKPSSQLFFSFFSFRRLKERLSRKTESRNELGVPEQRSKSLF